MRAAAPFAGNPGVSIPHMGISNGLTISFGRSPNANHAFRHAFFPSAFFFDDPEFWYRPSVEPVTQPVMVIPIQLTPAKETPEETETKSAEPLLIERHGDRFVRSRRAEMEEDSSMATENETAGRKSGATPASAEPPPAVLVFRDGHREQTSNYAIVGSELYLYFDYVAGGAWFKKIPLADLDLIATAAENRERGSKFLLPRGPNEIVVRP